MAKLPSSGRNLLRESSSKISCDLLTRSQSTSLTTTRGTNTMKTMAWWKLSLGDSLTWMISRDTQATRNLKAEKTPTIYWELLVLLALVKLQSSPIRFLTAQSATWGFIKIARRWIIDVTVAGTAALATRKNFRPATATFAIEIEKKEPWSRQWLAVFLIVTLTITVSSSITFGQFKKNLLLVNT